VPATLVAGVVCGWNADPAEVEMLQTAAGKQPHGPRIYRAELDRYGKVEFVSLA